MSAILNIAIKAARRAGTIIRRATDRMDALQVQEKCHLDFVTNIDAQVEEDIINTIRMAYPEHGILAEESGVTLGNDYVWIIDPIDGTTNFIRGFPQFAVSIAITYKNRLEHAIVYDPLLDELFSASRGQGANLNERRIRVSKRTQLEGALCATGIAGRNQKYNDLYINNIQALTSKGAILRQTGSAALCLAYVAAGRTDAYYEFGLKSWDIAAGALLVKEAGGLVSDFKGGEDYLETGSIVATSPKLLKEVLGSVGAP